MLKIVSVLFILSLFIFSACAWIQANPDTSKLIAKITSRRVGAELQKQYPDVAKEVKTVCKAILCDPDEGVLRSLMRVLLSEQIKDPMLVADISDLVAILKLGIRAKITEEQLTLIKIVAYELERGIVIWAGKKPQ